MIKILERSDTLDGRVALTVEWPDGTETVELVSLTALALFDALSEGKAPRRRVLVVLKVQGDSWSEVRGVFNSLAVDTVVEQKLPSQRISGGYSSGYIMVSSEDESITHDIWARMLDAYLEAMKKVKEDG